MSGYELRTAGNYPIDEASSALQKSIRRGNIRESMFWALELNSTFPEYVWRRLVVICCEDIGPANPTLVGTIASLANMVIQIRKASKTKTYDAAILGSAILEMARSPKSRQADNLVNQVLREMRLERERGEEHPVPDYALDVHMDRGRSMGRDILHFWEEGAKLENETPPSEFDLGDGFVGWVDGEGDGHHTADGKSTDPWKSIKTKEEEQPKLL